MKGACCKMWQFLIFLVMLSLKYEVITVSHWFWCPGCSSRPTSGFQCFQHIILVKAKLGMFTNMDYLPQQVTGLCKVIFILYCRTQEKHIQQFRTTHCVSKCCDTFVTLVNGVCMPTQIKKTFNLVTSENRNSMSSTNTP